MLEKINKAAKTTGMIQKEGVNSEKQETWDTGEYKLMRKKFFKLLHKFRKQRDWQNKVEYMQCRKELKSLRKRLIKEWLDAKQRLVAESRNITEWWKHMNWYRNKKKTKKNNISKTEWINHFKKFLEGEEEKEENGEENKETRENQNEPIEGDPNDLDEPLKQVEIDEAVGKLKEGKAAGEDGITVEFLKNLPEEG